jgi:hypothetical protein
VRWWAPVQKPQIGIVSKTQGPIATSQAPLHQSEART